MGRIGKLHAGTKEGDGAVSAAIEDCGSVRYAGVYGIFVQAAMFH